MLISSRLMACAPLSQQSRQQLPPAWSSLSTLIRPGSCSQLLPAQVQSLSQVCDIDRNRVCMQLEELCGTLKLKVLLEHPVRSSVVTTLVGLSSTTPRSDAVFECGGPGPTSHRSPRLSIQLGPHNWPLHGLQLSVASRLMLPRADLCPSGVAATGKDLNPSAGADGDARPRPSNSCFARSGSAWTKLLHRLMHGSLVIRSLLRGQGGSRE